MKFLKDNANLAYAFQITAQVHCDQHPLEDALAAAEAAWKYAELSDSPCIQGFISRGYAEILYSADRFMEGLARFDVSMRMLGEALNPSIASMEESYNHNPYYVQDIKTRWDIETADYFSIHSL